MPVATARGRSRVIKRELNIMLGKNKQKKTEKKKGRRKKILQIFRGLRT